MDDLSNRRVYYIIPGVIIGYSLGWVAGSILTGTWLQVAAWMLAVIAATMVTSAVIASGYETERRQHGVESDAARRRVASYESGWRAEKQRRLDAEKALRIANRLVKD